MPRRARSSRPLEADLSFWLLAGFLVLLWIAGGASRADAAGQVITRLSAWALLVVCALLSPRIEWRTVKPVAIILGATIIMVAAQLVPLPPAWWTLLPGRGLVEQAAAVIGQPQPWRPLSLSPGATGNALGSLVVPAAVLVLAAGLSRPQHWRILGLLVALVAAGCLIGLLQFSGSRFDNPLINDMRGAVSGNFANRNHLALFVAIGCVLAPVWGFRGDDAPRWKRIAAVTALPFFLLIVLATGSRAGIVLGGFGTLAGLAIVRRQARRDLRALPRGVAIGLVFLIAGSLILALGLAIWLDRALAVTRAIDLDAGYDLRGQALPYVWEAIGRYFPAGSGFGAFDPVYRIVEPDALLSPRYFNHAHNDWLEILLDGGVAAAVLLLAAFAWWLAASVRAWLGPLADRALPKCGSVVILLSLIASAADYPARTPMVMALLTLAGVWLNDERSSRERPADA